MATLGQIKGYIMKIYTGTAPGTAITCQVDCSYEVNANMVDNTCKDTDPGWESVIPGRKSWAMNGTAKFSFDAANGFAAIFAKITGDTLTTIRLTSGVTGDAFYAGSGYFESISLSAGVDDVAEYEFSFKGVGEPETGTV
jgi:predicted secreted protein